MAQVCHFILVEGVNLYAHLYDTEQLSVIRGTSFLYKAAIEHISQAFKNQLSCISSGASSGLYRVDQGDPSCLVTAIQDYLKPSDRAQAKAQLSSKPPFDLLTFQVVQASADTLLAAKEQLYARLRLAQLQNFTLYADHGQLSELPCALSGSRIAGFKQRAIQSESQRVLADSVYQRWEYGRKEKYQFYQNLISDKNVVAPLAQWEFATNIEELCEDPHEQLNHKMAVIYADGNQFSAYQKHYIAKATSLSEQVRYQQQFDHHIQQQRTDFLRALLEQLKPAPNTTLLRLETLMWGGDEMLLVVPAWQGFAVLQALLNFKWHIGDESLTYAAGLVFCQANTPIRIMQALARELAEGVKSQTPTKNGWDYLVLESIDYPSNERLGTYFSERYGATLAAIRPPALIAISDWLPTQRAALGVFLDGKALARSQLYRLVQVLQRAPPTQYSPTASTWQAIKDFTPDALAQATPQEQAEHRLWIVSEASDRLEGLPDAVSAWFGLDMHCAQERTWVWIHLLELWDYLIPAQQEM